MLGLKELPSRDIICRDVQTLRRRRHPHDERRTKLGEELEVELLTGRRDETPQGFPIEVDDRHAIAVIKVALNYDSQRIIVVVGHRQHDHAGLGSSRVAEAEPDPGGGGVLRSQRSRSE